MRTAAHPTRTLHFSFHLHLSLFKYHTVAFSIHMFANSSCLLHYSKTRGRRKYAHLHNKHTQRERETRRSFFDSSSSMFFHPSPLSSSTFPNQPSNNQVFPFMPLHFFIYFYLSSVVFFYLLVLLMDLLGIFAESLSVCSSLK